MHSVLLLNYKEVQIKEVLGLLGGGGKHNNENNLTIGGLRMQQILSLAMLQVLQKDSVNQTETAVVTRYPWLKMHAVTHTGGWRRSLKSLSEIMH